jgi:transcriptional regulator with XRE-family HTH domain
MVSQEKPDINVMSLSSSADTVQLAIKKLRAHLGGISQESLAHKMGLTVRTMARYEHRDGNPPADALRAFHQLAMMSDRKDLADIFWAAIEKDFAERFQSAFESLTNDAVVHGRSVSPEKLNLIRLPPTVDKDGQTDNELEDSLDEIATAVGIVLRAAEELNSTSITSDRAMEIGQEIRDILDPIQRALLNRTDSELKD